MATAAEGEGEEGKAAVDPAETILAERRDGAGKWLGDVRVIDPLEGSTMTVAALGENEMPISIAGCQFSTVRDGATYVVVGTVTDWDLKTQKFSSCSLNTYKLVGKTDRKTDLELMHRTPVDAIPSALHAFNGKLLVGVGNLLRLYDLGKKKLLRKCENKGIPNTIVSIESMGHRIVVSDLRDSYFFVKFKAAENQLVVYVAIVRCAAAAPTLAQAPRLLFPLPAVPCPLPLPLAVAPRCLCFPPSPPSSCSLPLPPPPPLPLGDDDT